MRDSFEITRAVWDNRISDVGARALAQGLVEMAAVKHWDGC